MLDTQNKDRPQVIDKPKTSTKIIRYMNKIYELKHADWMGSFREEEKKGHQIMIDDAESIDQRTMEINKGGIFTQKFKIPVNVDETLTEYSCACKAMKGRYYEGEICEECGTIVESQFSSDLGKMGWISVEPYFIIVPSIYKKLAAYMTPKKLMAIVEHKVEKDADGHELPVAPSNTTGNPFIGIGLLEFRKRYVEIIDYFYRYSKKKELRDILLNDEKITFSSKIPILSSVHRPAYLSPKNKKLNYHTINASLTKILTNFNLIKNGKRTGRKAVELMAEIQMDVMTIYELDVKKLNGKGQVVRGLVNSGRLNYSSRAVIISENENNNIDEVRVSYRCFISLYELEIINLMRKGYGNPLFAGWTTPECANYLKTCKFSMEVNVYIFKIIKTLIHERKDDGLYVLINRNPTFDLGSVLCVRISDVFPVVEKNILTVSHNSLKGMNADFDGDVLNIYSMKERCVIEAFKQAFLPSKLIVDKTGGYFNANMALIKDEYTFLRTFLDSNYEPMSPKDLKLKPIERALALDKFGLGGNTFDPEYFIFDINKMLTGKVKYDEACMMNPFTEVKKYKDGEYMEFHK